MAVGTAVQDDSSSPLKVGQPVQVTKAGQWIDELARVKKINADGTYDITVFSKFHSDTGSLKEDLVLTNKPYPDEVVAMGAAIQGQCFFLTSDALRPLGATMGYVYGVLTSRKFLSEQQAPSQFVGFFCLPCPRP